jgi:hypothetical protein
MLRLCVTFNGSPPTNNRNFTKRPADCFPPKTFVEAKMCTFTLESTHFVFNKCPTYSNDGASAKFSPDSEETDYSVCSSKISNCATIMLYTSESPREESFHQLPAAILSRRRIKITKPVALHQGYSRTRYIYSMRAS